MKFDFFVHIIYFSILEHVSHLYACVVSSSLRGKQVYVFISVMFRNICIVVSCSGSEFFSRRSYSFLACGAVDSLCSSFKEHLNLPRVQFREQFFAARPGVWSVSSNCLLSSLDTAQAPVVAVLLPDSSWPAADAQSCFAKASPWTCAC